MRNKNIITEARYEQTIPETRQKLTKYTSDF
jgi:hypothetical protein